MKKRGPGRMAKTNGQSDTGAEDYSDDKRGAPARRREQQQPGQQKDEEVKRHEGPETHFMAKGQEEILLKSPPYSAERIIHPHAYQILPIQTQAALAALAPQPRQAAVLEDPVAHSGVPAERKVALAFDHQTGPVSNSERWAVESQRKRRGED